MFVSIGEASSLIGVSVSTLRRWEKENRFHPVFRTKGKHRRYDVDQIRADFFCANSEKKTRYNVAYARVSSHDQRQELERQKKRLEEHCLGFAKPFELISDLGSGLRYDKRGLNQLLKQIFSGSVDTLFLTHRDRLLRFGSQLIFKICEHFGTKVVILDQRKEQTFEEELVGDLVEIMTVFCSRIYGKRSHSNRARVA